MAANGNDYVTLPKTFYEYMKLYWGHLRTPPIIMSYKEVYRLIHLIYLMQISNNESYNYSLKNTALFQACHGEPHPLYHTNHDQIACNFTPRYIIIPTWAISHFKKGAWDEILWKVDVSGIAEKSVGLCCNLACPFAALLQRGMPIFSTIQPFLILKSELHTKS